MAVPRKSLWSFLEFENWDCQRQDLQGQSRIKQVQNFTHRRTILEIAIPTVCFATHDFATPFSFETSQSPWCVIGIVPLLFD